MKVEIRLHKCSKEITHEATSTYQKGDLFCIRLDDGKTVKYPIRDIFQVIESEEE